MIAHKIIRTALVPTLILLSSCKHNPLSPTRDYEFNDVDPIWLPNGKIIYQHLVWLDPPPYRSWEAHSSSTWVIDPDGSNAHEIRENTEIAPGEGKFSPDGRWFVTTFYSESPPYYGEVYKMPVRGFLPDPSEAVQLTSGGNNFSPNWSRDGEHIVYYHKQAYPVGNDSLPSGTYLMRNDGTGKRCLAAYRGRPGDTPILSPDGKFLIHTHLDGECCNSFEVIVREIIADSSETIILAKTRHKHQSFRDVQLTPDGTKVIFRSYVAPGQGPPELNGIFTMHTDGSDLHAIFSPWDLYHEVKQLGGLSLSPDGRRIVFSFGDPDFPEVRLWSRPLWIINIDGTGLRQLTSQSTYVSHHNRHLR